MPCGGLTPFLPSWTASNVPFAGGCQCPVAGLLHFYRFFRFGARGYRYRVSMPCGGLTPFLLGEAMDDPEIALLCVNALWRAYSISTTKNWKDQFMSFVGCQCPVAG